MKHYMKKLVVSLLAMIIVSSTTAYASTTDAPTPRWSHLTLMRAYMEVDDYGRAEISVTCGADTLTVNNMVSKCELQQFDGKWKTIKSWNDSNDDSAIMYTKDYAIAKNYSYRLKITASAYWDSTLLESATEYFDYGYYN